MISPTDTEPPSENRPLDRDIEHGLRWTAIRQIVTALVGSVGVFFYARFLTPDALGAAALALLVYEGLYLLIRVPISHAVVYYQDEAEHPSAAFWLLLAFGLPAAALVIIFAPLMGRFFNSPEAPALTRGIMVTYIMLSLATVPGAILIKQMRFKYYEGFLTVYQLLGGIGWVVFSVLGFGAWSLILPSMFAAIFWVSAVWTVTRFRPRLPVSRRAFADIFRFARSLWGSELLKYSMLKIDNGVVAFALGQGALGLYQFGEDQSIFASLSVSAVIAGVTLPALAKVQTQLEAFKQTYLDMLRLNAAASMPMQIGALVVADLVMNLVFGNQWDGAVPIFRIYVAYQIIDTLTVLSDAAMSASGRPYVRLRMNLIQLPFFVFAAWFGVTVWGGIVGIAAALAIVRSIAAAVYLLITWRILRLSARGVIRALAPSTLAGAVMGAAAVAVRVFMQAPAGLMILAVMGIAAPLYFLLLWLIDRSAFAQVWDAGMQILVPAEFRTRVARRFPKLQRAMAVQLVEEV